MGTYEESDNDVSSSESEFEASEESTGPKDPNKKRKSNASNTKLKKVKYEYLSKEQHRKGKKKNDMYKPPTIEELNNLKETENLYNNNLFRLQITELVKELSVKNKRMKVFNSWLDNFKNMTETMPNFDDIKLSEIKSISKKKKTKTENFINSISKHYCDIKADQDVTLKLSKPAELQCFDLLECNSAPGPDINASINIKMPRSYFNVKDHSNNRYFIKRFYYLLYISEHVTCFKKSFTYHENNVLLPILQIQPTEDIRVQIKIYVTPIEDYFKGSRFLPNINNVKQDLFNSTISDVDLLKNSPTLLYNTAMAFDVTLQENYQYLKQLLSDHPNIQEGIKLLCVWLKQRDLNVGYGAFTESLILFFVGYLLAKKKLKKLMSSYQVIRIFWSFLCTHDLLINPISLGECSQDTLDPFKQSFDAVFLDYTGSYNLLAFLNIDTLKKVCSEASLAVQQLDSTKIDSFQSLFLTKAPFSLQYDLVIDLTGSLPLKHNITSEEDKCKAIGYEMFLNVASVSDLLHKGLNKRVLHLVPRIEVEYKDHSYPIKKLMFGVNLNPETAFNFLEIGPTLSDHIEAEKFRTFWGHLASDRRFRDGSTNVAVYFKTNTIRAKRNIIKRVIKYLLLEKYQLNFKLYYDDLEEFIINKGIKAPYPVGTNEEGCLKVITISDELGQKIRALQMSLSITGILGLSDLFCYCDLFPPVASSCDEKIYNLGFSDNNTVFLGDNIQHVPRYIKPVKLVLYMEHSSKWPNTLEGIRHIKTSFFLEIAKQLQTSHNIVSHITQNYLDVFYQGLLFRYVMFVPKEIALIKKSLSDTGVVKYTDTVKSFEMERTLTVLPKMVGALKGLQLQYPSYGSGTALIKKWLRSQLIDEFHIPDIVIDLLNASLYMGNSPYRESCTPQISFLRFLKFISQYQWELQPVIVNFNEEITGEDLVDLESRFQEHRKSIQPLYIITPSDQGQSLFTKHAPSTEILNRIKQLAEVTLNLILDRIAGTSFDLPSLFTPNMEGYDVIIHLNPGLNARRHEDHSGAEPQIILEKYVNKSEEKIPIVGFSPVDIYLKELWENYGEFAVFFHNSYGGNKIGVLWNPAAQEPKDFKVNLVSGRKLEGSKLVLNIDAIVDDFYTLGRSLVKWIEKK